MTNKRTGGKAYRQHQTLEVFVRERDNYTCQLCGAEGWIVDHIIPWRVSHDSSLSNLRVLCHACNLKTRRQRHDVYPFESINQWEDYLRQEIAAYASRNR